MVFQSSCGKSDLRHSIASSSPRARTRENHIIRVKEGEKVTTSPIDVEVGVPECTDKDFVTQKHVVVFELQFSKSLNELRNILRIGALGLARRKKFLFCPGSGAFSSLCL
jgi:hypothetical protein